MSTFDLTITKTIPASPQTVFEAWLSPKALASFMTPAAGMSVVKAESDGKEGGAFLVVMKAGEQELPHSGVYRTIRRYELLEFTWNNPFNDVESIVTISFAEEGEGQTMLTLRHTGLATEESRNNHKGGWTAIVEALVAMLGA